MRRIAGPGGVRGMCGVTLFGIFLTPVFFYVIQRHFGVEKPSPHSHPQPTPPDDNGHSVRHIEPPPANGHIKE